MVVSSLTVQQGLRTSEPTTCVDDSDVLLRYDHWLVANPSFQEEFTNISVALLDFFCSDAISLTGHIGDDSVRPGNQGLLVSDNFLNEGTC